MVRVKRLLDIFDCENEEVKKAKSIIEEKSTILENDNIQDIKLEGTYMYYCREQTYVACFSGPTGTVGPEVPSGTTESVLRERGQIRGKDLTIYFIDNVNPEFFEQCKLFIEKYIGSQTNEKYVMNISDHTIKRIKEEFKEQYDNLCVKRREFGNRMQEKIDAEMEKITEQVRRFLKNLNGKLNDDASVCLNGEDFMIKYPNDLCVPAKWYEDVRQCSIRVTCHEKTPLYLKYQTLNNEISTEQIQVSESVPEQTQEQTPEPEYGFFYSIGQFFRLV